MSGDLPLKIRVDIRDQWDSKTSVIKKGMEDLQTSLGHKIDPSVQWALLYNSLKGKYEDKATFVPAIVRITKAFYDRMLSRIENEKNSEWTENLLGELAKKANGNWKLRLEVPTTCSRPKLFWKCEHAEFILEIPNCILPGLASIELGIDQDLDRLFNAPAPQAFTTTSVNDDEWAEVRHVPAAIDISEALIRAPRPQELPDVETLNRPDTLYANTVPYIMTVNSSVCPMVIQCSHQPSLELLASYLQKWAKIGNDSNRQPVLKGSLIESAYFHGVIDCLLIEPTYSIRSSGPLNPALVLGFIEGVLGYKETYCSGSYWIYKMDTPMTGSRYR